MSGLIDLMAEIFIFIIEAIFDLISFAVWLASFAAVWRLPWSIRIWRGTTRWKYREFCWGNFLALFVDTFTIVPMAIVTASWRLPLMIARVHEKWDRSDWDIISWCYETRAHVWIQFGNWILDIPCIIMLAITHCIFWHIPQLYMELYREMKVNGAPICLLGDNHRNKFREIIFMVFIDALLDIFCLPALIILGISYYRIPIVRERFADIDKSISSNTTTTRSAVDRIKGGLFEKKGEIFIQAALVLCDLPFAIIGILALVIPLGFRGKALWEDLDFAGKQATSAGDRRRAVLLHFILAIRDLLCFPLFIIVLCSIYRGFLAIKKMIDAVSRWCTNNPAIYALSVVPVLPSRGNGLIFHVKGSKAADFVLPQGIPVKLYIRNTSFWDEVRSTFGAAAGSIGQTMLPMTLPQRYFDPLVLKPNTTECEFDIDFNTHYATSVIMRNCKKFDFRAACDAHMEFGDHEGTLLFLRVNVSQLENFAQSNQSVEIMQCIPSCYTSEHTSGQRLCDVFWKIVLMQLLWLLIDIAAIVSFFILHLFPHRVLRLYGSGCEGNTRKKARKIVDIIQSAQLLTRRKTQIFHDTIVEVDDGVRTSHMNDWRWCYRYGRGYYRYDYRSCSYNYRSFEKDQKNDLIFCSPDAHKRYIDQLKKYVKQLTEQGAMEGAAAVKLCLDKFDENLRAYGSVLKAKFGADAEGIFDSIEERLQSLALRQVSTRTEELEPFQVQYSDTMLPEERRELQLAIKMSAQEAQQSQPPAEMREPDSDGNGHSSLFAILQRSKEQDVQIAAAIKQAIDKAEADFSATKWCGGKEGWEGFRSAIFFEVSQLLFDLAAVLCFIITFCTVYRTYSLIYAVTHSDNWRKAAVLSFLEIFIDLWYLFKYALVTIGIKGILTLPADIIFFLLRKPSFFVARQVIDHHLLLLGSDILYLLSLFFAWDMIRVVAATAVFGLFAPGVMLEGALSEWEFDSGDRRYKIAHQGLCFSIVLLVIALWWVIGLPLLVGLYILKHSSTAAKAVFFGFNMTMILIGAVSTLARRDENLTKIRRSIVRFLRPTWHNASAFLAIALEWAQLLGLLFSAATPELYGSDASAALEKASRYVFLLFGEDWAAHGIPLGVYFALACACLSFVVAAAPIVMGDMLKWRKGHELMRSAIWIALMQFFTQFCLLLLVRNMSLMLMCDRVGGPMLFAPKAKCWEGRHLGITITCMVFLAYSVPSALMRNMKYDESICQSLDVVYPQLYKLLVNVVTATSACITLLYQDSPVGVSITMLVTSLWALSVTLLYGRILNPDEGVACSVESIHGWKSAAYGSVAVGSIMQLIAAASKSEALWPLYVTIGASVACLAGAIARSVHLRRQRIQLDDSIEELQGMLLYSEAMAIKKRAMQDSWTRIDESNWQGSVRSATRVSQLALLAIQFERKIFVATLPKLFMDVRNKWAHDVRSLVSACDEDQLFDIEYELPDGDVLGLIICCDWGCDSHLRRRYDDDSHEAPELTKLPALQEGIIALRNAIGAEQRSEET